MYLGTWLETATFIYIYLALHEIVLILSPENMGDLIAISRQFRARKFFFLFFAPENCNSLPI